MSKNCNGKQITKGTNEIYQLDFLKEVVLNNPLEKSSDQLLSQSTLLIVFNQQKVSKNEMVKHIASSNSRICQKDFFKVAFLNRPMKGAVAGFFRRAPC